MWPESPYVRLERNVKQPQVAVGIRGSTVEDTPELVRVPTPIVTDLGNRRFLGQAVGFDSVLPTVQPQLHGLILLYPPSVALIASVFHSTALEQPLDLRQTNLPLWVLLEEPSCKTRRRRLR